MAMFTMISAHFPPKLTVALGTAAHTSANKDEQPPGQEAQGVEPRRGCRTCHWVCGASQVSIVGSLDLAPGGVWARIDKELTVGRTCCAMPVLNLLEVCRAVQQ